MMCYIKGREISIFHRLFCFEKVMQNGELCFTLFVNFVCKYSILHNWGIVKTILSRIVEISVLHKKMHWILFVIHKTFVKEKFVWTIQYFRTI